MADDKSAAARSQSVGRARDPQDGQPIASVLTERPAMLRTMICGEIEAIASRLQKAMADDSYYVERGMVRSRTEKEVTRCVRDLHECMTMLAQLGWR